MTDVTPIPKKGKPARKAKQIPSMVRAEVRQRSHGWCEFTVDGRHRCGHLAVHMHHIRRRSQGGTNDPSNLVHLCEAHHRHIHANPADAYAAGYLTRGN